MKYLGFIICLISAIAFAYEDSEGMRAMRLGCEKQKLGLGCTNYANFLIKNGRESEADAYFDKAFKLGHQEGCDKKRWVSKEKEPEVPLVDTTPDIAIDVPSTPVEETPAQTPSDVPVETPAEVPTEATTETPVEAPAETTADPSKPAE